MAEPVLRVRGLSVATRSRTILRDVDLDVRERQVLAIIGPSGAGKTTLLRCLDRLTDLDPDLEVRGEVLFRGRPIAGPRAEVDTDLDVDDLRARIGILFQQPVVFPTNIRRNVLFGARRVLRPRLRRRAADALAERALREAALWEEVVDRLDEPATRLSVGQKQRLCLARTLALDPEVILMDEPTSSLDVRATAAIERLVRDIAESRTVVLVTHDLGQARRVADTVVCVALRGGVGRVVAAGPRDEILGRSDDDAIARMLAEDPAP